jgi:hypothetical protein
VKLTTQLYLVPRIKMGGTIPLLPQYVFMAWCLVKHRDNFTFCSPVALVITMIKKQGSIKEGILDQ